MKKSLSFLHSLTRRRSAIWLVLALCLLVFPLIVFADNVVNDAGGDVTVYVGESTTIWYQIEATTDPEEQFPRCNASIQNIVTVTIKTPTNVTASPSFREFAKCDDPQPFTFTASVAGDYAIEVTASDRFGLQYDTSGATFTLHVLEQGGDTTPPVITPSVAGTMGNNGWYTSDVSVSWTVEDPESGIVSSNGCGNTLIDYDTMGVTLTCEATNGVNLSNSVDLTIKRDATAPVVSVTGVVDGATYILGDVPTAGCDTSDATSGVFTVASLTLSGGNPDGSGIITADCTGALDKAGNSGSASATYTVLTQQEAITNIEYVIDGLVDDGVLNNGQATGLTKPLQNAIRSLDKGNTADACNQLADFILEVYAKTPSPLDAATAAVLVADAQAVQTAIGCP